MLTFISSTKQPNLIIFLHGFMGGKETWVREDGKKSLLDYLNDQDLIKEQFDLAYFIYEAKLFPINKERQTILNFLFRSAKKKIAFNLPITDISDLLESEIKVHCKSYKRIIIIAHSMGGLVAKSLIIKNIKANNNFPICLFISLVVPHQGSELATYGKLLIKNPQIYDLRPLSSIVDQLNDSWIEFDKESKLPDVLYFTGKYDLIVTQISAVAIGDRNKKILKSAHDHFSIVIHDPKYNTVAKAIEDEC